MSLRQVFTDCDPFFLIHLRNKSEIWCHETSLSPPVKKNYWPFKGGASFVDLF